MSDFLKRIGQLSPKQLAVLADGLYSRLQEREDREREPVAIVGMSCRFPSAPNLESYWDLLHQGQQAISEVPPSRWKIEDFYDPSPKCPGKMCTRFGSFLNDIELFDREFFGISPREAESLDPQQRLLLEVAWEALENAGQASSVNSDTGVFIGLGMSNYRGGVSVDSPHLFDAYSLSGNTSSIAAGRISHLLGLKGPNFSIDAACSSSLIAVHQACNSLRARECQMTLVGGVNLTLTPEPSICFSQAGLLSRSGSCRSFDARADGYIRGEGCGVLVLKRLSDAQSQGDPILATIQGTAVNHNGGGLSVMAPSGRAQQDVILRALENAQLKPEQIDYIEGQGAATSFGDAIELQALAKVYGKGRSNKHPLHLGAVKANLGHLESASGMAGLIKTVLALRHQQLLPQPQFSDSNPCIDWKDNCFQVALKSKHWPLHSDRRYAGVSTFSFSGANAHVIIADAPASQDSTDFSRGSRIRSLCLSAKSPSALSELARSTAARLETLPVSEMGDAIWSMNAGRASFEYRIAVDASSKETTIEALRKTVVDEQGSIPLSKRIQCSPNICFLFGDWDGQWWSQILPSLLEIKSFRTPLKRCERIAQKLAIPFASTILNSTSIIETKVIEGSLEQFSLQFALAQMWRSWGVNPSSILAFGSGVLPAACAVDALTLESAFKLLWVERKSAGNQVKERESEIAEQLSQAFRLALPETSFLSPLDGAILSSKELGESTIWKSLLLSSSAPSGIFDALPQPGESYLVCVGNAIKGQQRDPNNAVIPARYVAVSINSQNFWQSISDKLSQLYLAGTIVNWKAVELPNKSRWVSLPNYPFQRDRCWLSVQPRNIANAWRRRDLSQSVDSIQFERVSRLDRAYLAACNALHGLGNVANGDSCLCVTEDSEFACAVVAVARDCGAKVTFHDPESHLDRDLVKAFGECSFWDTQPDNIELIFEVLICEHVVAAPTHLLDLVRAGGTCVLFGSECEAWFLEASSRNVLIGRIDLDSKLANCPSIVDEHREWLVEFTSELEDNRRSLSHGLKMPEVSLESLLLLSEVGRESTVLNYLCNELSDVLRLPKEKLDLDRQVFELGLDSISAMSLKARVEQRLAISIPLVDLLDNPSLRQLAVRLYSHVATRLEASSLPRVLLAPPISQVNRKELLPLSYAQQRLWFLDQLQPNSAFYNMPALVRVIGPLDVKALHQSVQQIVNRHESLRTVFGANQGEPFQRILPSLEIDLPIVDLGSLEKSKQESEVRRQAMAEGIAPFDLSTGPLVRMRLYRLGAEEHVFQLTMHHIVSDGWSMGVLLRELAVLYEANHCELPSPLSSLPIQYADYSQWQRSWLTGEVLAEQIAWWAEQLQEMPWILELPTDHPRPAVQSYRGLQTSYSLSSELSGRLEQLSREQGATLFMTLMSAWQIVMARYSSQERLLIGTPIANRHHAETESLIGFFVNTLVIGGDVSENPTFTDYLAQIRSRCLGAYAHQDLPFEQLVEHLNPRRDLSRSPLFQVSFALQNAPLPDNRLPDGLRLSPVELESHISRFDLELHAWPQAEQGIRLQMVYNSDLFDVSTIDRMLVHFERLLEGVVEDPQQRVGELPLLTESEQEQILIEWNDTAVEFPSDKCVHELFQEQVGKTPDAIALVFEEQQLSYGELNRRANQLAHYLRERGVGPDVLVGICVERSIKMIVGLLGILKAGGAYVPLDPEYPRDRLSMMLADTAAPVLVSQKSLEGIVPEYTGQVVLLDEGWNVISKNPCTNPVTINQSSDLAYVIYTSGSTGTPKGSLLAHSCVNRLFSATSNLFAFADNQVWTMFHSLAFDFSVWEIWGALLFGSRLVVVSNNVRQQADQFYELLLNQRVTILSQTPSSFYRLMAVEQTHGDSSLFSLRDIIFGGEALRVAALDDWYRRHVQDQPRLINMYGITETTVHVTYCQLDKGDLTTSFHSPIGQRIADLSTYVLDSSLQPVPIGVWGELYIGGAGLARGYLNRRSLTAERFVPNPFSVKPGARLYKTGDQVRLLADGNLDFIGRLDHQVKIRGYRIELGEVESALRAHPAVEHAVVVAHEDGSRGKQLVAYVVSDVELSPSVLRDFLQSCLPSYMIPSQFVVLDSLPLTPSGKLDRRALPAPDGSRPELEQHYVAPRTAVELQLAHIWSEVLGVDRVGIHDNFFELGGHSLLAIRLVHEIESSLGLSAPLKLLFEKPTIAELVPMLYLDSKPDSTSLIIPIRIGGPSTPILFMVHPAGGMVFCYNDFARHLEGSISIYGIQASGIEHGSPLRTIEEMARRYVSEIQSVQPIGPYIISGWSFGGPVAFEMAQQLMRQGERVEKVILFDAILGLEGDPMHDVCNQDYAMIIDDFSRQFPELGLMVQVEELALFTPEEQIDKCLVSVKGLPEEMKDLARDQARRIFDVFALNVAAQGKHRAEVYEGQITLIRATESNEGGVVFPSDLTARCTALSTVPPDVYSIAARHNEMFSAVHAPKLAAIVDKILSKRDLQRSPIIGHSDI